MIVAVDSATLVGSFTNCDKPLVSNILFSLMFGVVELQSMLKSPIMISSNPNSAVFSNCLSKVSYHSYHSQYLYVG